MGSGTTGLFHLRGSVCEQIGAPQGYPGGLPICALTGHDGTLWVKTRTSPLLFLPPGESKFQTSEYGEGTSTGYAWLHETPDGTIWLSDDQGLRRVTSKGKAPAFTPPRKGYKNNAQFGDFTLAADGSLLGVNRQGRAAVRSCGEMVRADGRGNCSRRKLYPGAGAQFRRRLEGVVDREGVWVATNSGLDLFRHAVLTTVGLPHAQEHEFSIAAGERGSVWTGNSSLPLTHVAADGTIATFPATRQTGSVHRDHNGTIWSADAGDFHLWRSSGAGSSPCITRKRTWTP